MVAQAFQRNAFQNNAFQIGGANSPLFLSSTFGMSVGDKVQIMLNDGTLFSTTIKMIIAPGEILITNPLPYFASAGNLVIDVTKTKTVQPSRAENSTDLGG